MVNKEKSTLFNFVISNDQKKRLEELSAIYGISQSEVIKRLLDNNYDLLKSFGKKTIYNVDKAKN